jgi:hypothetical protein
MSNDNDGMRYQTRVPRKLKAGRVLVHNHIVHTKDMPAGVNGFRFWTQKRAHDVVPCKCGWQRVPHYRVCGWVQNSCYPGTWERLEAKVARKFRL